MPKQAAGPLRTQNPSFFGSTDVTELTLHWVRQSVAQAGGTVNHVAVVVVVVVVVSKTVCIYCL